MRPAVLPCDGRTMHCSQPTELSRLRIRSNDTLFALLIASLLLYACPALVAGPTHGQHIADLQLNRQAPHFHSQAAARPCGRLQHLQQWHEMSGPGEVCLLLLHVCCAAARLQLLQPPALMAGSAPGTVVTQLHQVDHLKQPRLRQDLRNASDEPKRPGCHLPSGQNSFRKADRQSICSSWCDHNHAPEPAHCRPNVMPQHRHRSWGLQPSPWATPIPMLSCHCGSLSLTLRWRTASESRSQHAAWLLTVCLAPLCSPLNAYVTVQPLPTGPPNAPCSTVRSAA